MTITANTGANDWNTNGAWVGGVQPTAADDVIIPATATVNIPAATTVLGRSLTVQASATLIFAATTSTCTLGDGTSGLANVALSVSATATITLTGIGTINFLSTSATTQTITTNGKTLPNMTVNGTGGTFQLADNCTSTGILTLLRGTFDTNSKTCTWASVNVSTTTARTLTLGSSAITVTGTGIVWTSTTLTLLTVTANTAVVTFTGTAPNISGAVFNWNGMSIVLTGGGIAILPSFGNTWANVTYTGTAVQTGVLRWSVATHTVTGTFTVTGQSTVNRVLVQNTTMGATATINAVAVSLTNVDFQDTAGTGAAAPFTGTSLGDCQGNSGITFDSPLTLYRVGAAGNWSTSNWSLSSGGATGQRIPLPQDTVNVDGSASGTITNDMPRMGQNLNFTGFTGIFSLNLGASIYGNLTFGTGMTSGGTSSIFTFSGRGSQTITSNGVTMTFRPQINTFGGTYTLQDAFTNVGTGALFTLGTFTSNNFNCSFPVVTVQGATMNMGSSTWSLSGSGAAWTYTSGIINPGTSTIVISVSTGTLRTFAGGGQTYNNFSYIINGSVGQLNVTGSNTFNAFNFSDTTNARTLAFTAGTTNIFTTFNVNGTVGKLMTVTSITAATHTLSKASGTVSDDYLSITNSIATGGAGWYAGANSTDGGGNTGWNFTVPPAGGGVGSSRGLLMGIG